MTTQLTIQLFDYVMACVHKLNQQGDITNPGEGRSVLVVSDSPTPLLLVGT